jgi:hypothetical protein
VESYLRYEIAKAKLAGRRRLALGRARRVLLLRVLLLFLRLALVRRGSRLLLQRHVAELARSARLLGRVLVVLALLLVVALGRAVSALLLVAVGSDRACRRRG